MAVLRVDDDNPSPNKNKMETMPINRKREPRKKWASSRKSEVPQADSSIQSLSFPNQCTPDLKGLLHFEGNTQKLFQCDGISWTLWSYTDQGANMKTCPSGWSHHDGSCYVPITEQKVKWNVAARTCREHLVGEKQMPRSSTALSVFESTDVSGRLNDQRNPGQLEWHDGERVAFTNWKRDPPRLSKKGRNCILVQRQGKWQRKDCRKGRGHDYICSRKL